MVTLRVTPLAAGGGRGTHRRGREAEGRRRPFKRERRGRHCGRAPGQGEREEEREAVHHVDPTAERLLAPRDLVLRRRSHSRGVGPAAQLRLPTPGDNGRRTPPVVHRRVHIPEPIPTPHGQRRGSRIRSRPWLSARAASLPSSRGSRSPAAPRRSPPRPQRRDPRRRRRPCSSCPPPSPTREARARPARTTPTWSTSPRASTSSSPRRPRTWASWCHRRGRSRPAPPP